MPLHDRPLSPAAAAIAVAVTLAVPLSAAAWILLRPPADGTQIETLPEPDVFETEMEPYDWGAIRAGDWVEHDVATSSPMDVSSRVRTRIACVGIEGDTAWVEQRDHIVARLFPGTAVLLEVERSSGRIARAWWGAPGEPAKSIEVRRIATGAGPPGFERRARVDAATLSLGGRLLPCTRSVIQERAAGGPWSSRSAVWLAPEIPFPRRATVTSTNAWVEWDGSAGTGGVAREEFTGLAVRMTMEVAAWGRDARGTVRKR